MISLNDSQLGTVMAAASQVPHEKRAVFLERVGAALRCYDNRYIPDAAIAEAAAKALKGLVHESAA